jgi:hypothetical protein
MFNQLIPLIFLSYDSPACPARARFSFGAASTLSLLCAGGETKGCVAFSLRKGGEMRYTRRQMND